MSALNKRTLLLALAVCVAFSVVFAENLAAVDIDHDCIGPNCPVCLAVKAGQNLLKTLKFAGSLLFAVFLTFFAQISKRHIGLNASPLSPIALKVRFNA